MRTTGLATKAARLIAVFWSLLGAVAAMADTRAGSGFFVNTAGWIVTNAHVAEGCTTLEIPGHGPARLVFADPETDLAALVVKDVRDYTPLTFRTARARLAESVAAVGFPLTDVLSESVRVTTGTISSLSGISGDPRMLQISAPLQPGNSGGPVLDARGLVVGVATSTLSDQVYDQAQNVNFAISAETVMRFLGQNGIAFNGAAGAVSGGDLSVAAETGAQGTVLIRCIDANAAPPPTASSGRTTTRSPDLTVLTGKDVIGFDYRSLPGVSLAVCESACAGHPRCVAFTYNQRYRHCFLKENAMITVNNRDAVSGVRRYHYGEVVQTGFRVQANMDSVGGDYARIRRSDFIPCFLECAQDNRCRGFAYVRRTRDCWLKDRIGRLQPMDGVEFGLK